ncbi:MAG: YbaN family protein [Candidatus Eisenbacteria bacterium]|uniref:YbaN family protein n=1 Tax=Eiseniibacteriota bacterium TaxID=2212470 RepID=A0A956LZ42_UNCEI|nr:YbaN family protein [Candidatus Eisenbacteria bacterium]
MTNRPERSAPETCPAIQPLPTVRRWIYIGIGSLSVALGTIGLFVPGLPTTIFLIVASWFFVRSSPALHHKLISHPRLGPPLRRFMETRAMPRRAKVAAVTSMWLGIGSAIAMTWHAPLLLHLAMAAFAMTGTFVVLFCVHTLPASATKTVTEPRARSSH